MALRAGRGELLTLGGRQITAIKRTGLSRAQDRYVVKTILSPRDEAIDLSSDQVEAALALTNVSRAIKGLQPTDVPGGPQIRHIRGLGAPDGSLEGHPERGLLLVYPLSPEDAGVSVAVPVVGVVVSFPASRNSRPIRYRYNSVLARLELEGQ